MLKDCVTKTKNTTNERPTRHYMLTESERERQTKRENGKSERLHVLGEGTEMEVQDQQISLQIVTLA